jgi:hypothetical protein
MPGVFETLIIAVGVILVVYIVVRVVLSKKTKD